MSIIVQKSEVDQRVGRRVSEQTIVGHDQGGPVVGREVLRCLVRRVELKDGF